MIITPPRPPLTPPLGLRDHIIGPDNAPHTLVMFGDYQCAHCQAAHEGLWGLVNGQQPFFRLAWRHFPLARMHPLARHAAMVAEAAAAMGKFWPMHELLFRRPPQLEIPQLLQYARQLGMNPDQLRSDLEKDVYAARLQEDLSSGVNSTPTLYIDGRRHNGTYAADVVLAALQSDSTQASSADATT